jgi:hypothetical protein
MRFRFVALFLAPMLTFASVAVAIIREPWERAVIFARGLVGEALALFTPDAPRLAGEAFGLNLNIGGTAVAADVQQALRHESRTSRIGSPRHL